MTLGAILQRIEVLFQNLCQHYVYDRLSLTPSDVNAFSNAARRN